MFSRLFFPGVTVWQWLLQCQSITNLYVAPKRSWRNGTWWQSYKAVTAIDSKLAWDSLMTGQIKQCVFTLQQFPTLWKLIKISSCHHNHANWWKNKSSTTFYHFGLCVLKEWRWITSTKHWFKQVRAMKMARIILNYKNKCDQATPSDENLQVDHRRLKLHTLNLGSIW